MTTPNLVQVEFRARNDDVTLNSATFTHALNANFTQAVDTPFRVRFTIAETAGGMANNIAYSLQYNLAGAGFVAIGDTAAVKSALSNQFANADPTTQVISTGSFVAGAGYEQTTTSNITLLSQRTEIEWCLSIDSAQVTNGQTFTLRVVQAAGAVLQTYTQTPTITVSESLAEVTGTGAGTLIAATGAASGSLTIAGTAAGTLTAATGDADGTASGLEITGNGAGSLTAATGTADGDLTIGGTAAGNLAAATGSADGDLTIAGTGAGTLAAGTGDADGASVGGPTPVADVNINAALNVDTTYLIRVRVENTGAEGSTGFKWQYNHASGGWTDITAASANVKAVAASSFANDADVPELLGGTGTYLTNNDAATEDGTTTLAANFPASGAVEFVLAFQLVGADVSDAQTGQIRLEQGDGTDFAAYTNTFTYTVEEAGAGVSGTGAGTLTAAVGAASGVIGLTGAAAGTLQAATGTASGALSIEGTAAGVLQATTGSATGPVEALGDAAGTLTAATGAAAAELVLAGTAAGNLAAVTGAATGEFFDAVEGTAAGALQAATGTSIGIVDVVGDGAGQLAAATGDADGSVQIAEITGTAAGILATATGTAVGAETLEGTAAGALAAATGAASGNVIQFVGTAAGQLSAAIGVASGELAILGNATGDLAAAEGSSEGLADVIGIGVGGLSAATGLATGTNVTNIPSPASRRIRVDARAGAVAVRGDRVIYVPPRAA